MRTFKDLLDRIAAVQGVPYAELAAAHGLKWKPEAARNKGIGGAFVEAVLGVKPNSRPEADLTFLGLEIKTIPVGEDLRVLENTKVTSLNPQDVHDHEWEVSTAWHKTRSVLFVPVVKFDLGQPDQWYIRSPFIWMPSLVAQAQFKRDYDGVRRLLQAGRADEISSALPAKGGQGHYLIANTGGRDSSDMVDYEFSGGKLRLKRRSWMLRKSFMQQVIDENVRYRAPTPEGTKLTEQALLPDLPDAP